MAHQERFLGRAVAFGISILALACASEITTMGGGGGSGGDGSGQAGSSGGGQGGQAGQGGLGGTGGAGGKAGLDAGQGGSSGSGGSADGGKPAGGAAGSDASADFKPLGDVPPPPPPGAMVCDPPEATKVAAGGVCLIDVGMYGSDAVFLWNITKAPALVTERVCKVSFPFSQYTTFNPLTNNTTPLSTAQRQDLAGIFEKYKGICQADKGQMGYAYTDEWERSTADIKSTVPGDPAPSTRNGYGQRIVPSFWLEIWPTHYTGYYAIFALSGTYMGGGSVSTPALVFGKTRTYVAFDGGGNVSTGRIYYGYGQGGEEHFAKKNVGGGFVHPSYDAAAASYETALKAAFNSTHRDPDIATPADFTKQFIGWSRGAVSQLMVETENGFDDSLPMLALAGRLNAGGKWVDEATYLALLAQQPKKVNPIGTVTAADVTKLRDLFKDNAIFDALRSSPAWDVYGAKLAGMPVMFGYLIKLVGVRNFVFTPRGVPHGGVVRGGHI